jgi:hypothetical protein
MRNLLIGLALIASTSSLAACGSTSKKAEAPKPASAIENAAPAATEKPEEVEKFKQKEVPELGDSETQLAFKAADSSAIIDNKPRPTTPPVLATLAGNPPPGTDVCKLPYSALIQAMVAQCFPEGTSYIQMSNVIGWKGEMTASSGGNASYVWKSGEGILAATFVDGKLAAKTSQGLK